MQQSTTVSNQKRLNFAESGYDFFFRAFLAFAARQTNLR
jgi:hypothetical protein